MPSLQQVRDQLPPFRNEKVLIKQKQGTDDIINEIVKTHTLYESDYDRIYNLFDTGNIYTTANGIYNFLKYNLTYNEETGNEQSVKSPTAILHQGEKIDCKHYSLFAGGVLDAIRREFDEPWDWCYRFATDKKGYTEPTHVFVVIFDGKREIWIDPCLAAFDYHKKWDFYTDRAPMSLVRISGPSPESPLITVDKNMAWTSFLLMVQQNMFGIKDLLINGSDVTFTLVKAYCDQNGFDFSQLLNFAKS